jgi:hypothetical protein
MVSTSPMETLLSYALVFAAGVVSVFVIRAYGEAQRKRGRQLAEMKSAT